MFQSSRHLQLSQKLLSSSERMIKAAAHHVVIDLLTVGLLEPQVVEGKVEVVENFPGPFPLDSLHQGLLRPDLLPEEAVLLEDRLVHVLQLLPLEVLLQKGPENGLLLLHVLQEVRQEASNGLLQLTAVLVPENEAHSRQSRKRPRHVDHIKQRASIVGRLNLKLPWHGLSSHQ